ncbi:hypothetical protein HGO38_29555 [Rhizobium sp. CG5]|uniref:hypothetical protein n=1 Tax=Rhizobium sp. CG5 TaxID=2726076 RepID=UPI00203452AF|nr:hypothetical protein [Rhizobium sp. CG5]MCM2477598.1 hypothetical protein [Rhizobium sp. CG5]
MNTLEFFISESLASNDHQVRVIIDGKDWLGEDHLGIDPPELFEELAHVSSGKLLIGRCDCGCVGCADLVVQIRTTGETTEWHDPSGKMVSFETSDYLRKVDALTNDHSWEPVGRTVERLVSEKFAATSTDQGHTFQWSSTRIQDGIISLSFSNGKEQQLLSFEWDSQTLESALTNADVFYRENFHSA